MTRILVCDDDADIVSAVKIYLSAEGYNVTGCSNGADAIEAVKNEPVQLVIMDIMMPKMDGITAVAQIRAFSNVPVIFLSAKGEDTDKVLGLNIGADDYITKPFNLDMLMLKVERIVEKSGSHEETQNREPEVESAEAETTRQYSVRDEKLVERATFYINENISKIDLTVEELSESLGISRVHLYKKILGVTGMTPLELIRALRVERGKHLLRDSQLNVSEVAYMVGFNSPRYFSKYFKDMYGMLPSEYQKNHCTK
jgi:DNA-binding response OmpR family regulator